MTGPATRATRAVANFLGYSLLVITAVIVGNIVRTEWQELYGWAAIVVVFAVAAGVLYLWQKRARRQAGHR